MKKTAFLLMLTTCMAGGAWASEEAEDRGFYLGVTAGKHKVDVDDLSGGTAGGLVGGYRISNGFGVEVAFTASEFDVDVAPGCLLEFDTAAIYGVFRSSGPVYFKGRAGFLREELTSRDLCVGLIEGESDSGLSFGIGGGFRFGKGAFEVEYTLVEQDVDQIQPA